MVLIALLGLMATNLRAETAADTVDWRARTEQDLAGAREILKQDTMGAIDSSNPAFRSWLDVGYRRAKKMARGARSFDGYYYAMEFFANGFEDAHIKFSAQSGDDVLYWPEFVVAYRGGRFVVHSSETADLPVGSLLLSCDGETPRVLLKKDVFPYTLNPAVESHWYQAAPKLFFDGGNPFVKRPEKCRFRVEGKPKDLTLRWAKARDALLGPKIEAATFGPRPQVGDRMFAPRASWFSFSAFFPNSRTEIATLKAEISKLALHRDDRVVVLDLRGNTGGGSTWGDQIVESLWGEPRFRRLQAKAYGEKTFDEWRVSKDNLETIQAGYLPMIEKRSGKESLEYREMREIEADVAAALASGRQTFHGRMEGQGAKSLPASATEPPVRAKVFVLTDGRCFSACLSFMDLLREDRGVVHVGVPTGADTFYEDIWRKRLPSGIGLLTYPMDAVRNRKRGLNQFYRPRFFWRGDMGDTKALERWILELARR